MIKTYTTFLVLTILAGPELSMSQVCPGSEGPMVRLGDSRYYIFHKPKVRSYHQDFATAKKLCESKPNFKMATIRDFTTFHFVGRMLEEWAAKNDAKDTWYWLDAKFDPKQEKYIWSDNASDPLKFTNFFYRYPRPSGVGSQVDWHEVYQKNSSVEQCLSFSLPLPRDKKGDVVYGFSATFDEKPCEGSRKRHAICESTLSECNSKIRDPFYLTEDKRDYFESGNWIIGDRKYIVNWKPRTQLESQEYCAKLKLQPYYPILSDQAIIPHLKFWSRNVTVSQFWTSWKYVVKYGVGVFEDPSGNIMAVQRSFVVDNGKVFGRSNKDSMTFCVAMQLSYEFRDQLPCSATNNACRWSFIEHVPTNCNNYIGTICTHEDYKNRLIEWNEAYIKSPDLLINDAMKATTSDFMVKGNNLLRRSLFKQTFGSFVCPPNYRMPRAIDFVGDFEPQGDYYEYDWLDSYWVVDPDYFNKTEVSECIITVPIDNGNQVKRTRELRTVPCDEWHFYLCKREALEIRTPSEKLPYEIPKPQGWSWNRNARIYPVLGTNRMSSWPNENFVCQREGGTRLQLLFTLDRTQTFKNFIGDFQNVADQLITEIEDNFPNSEFGIAAFADFPFYTQPSKERIDPPYLGNTSKLLNACYELIQPLTKNRTLFKNKTLVGTVETDGGAESSLTAVTFAAADRRVGWSKVDVEPNGVKVFKIQVLVTDEAYSTELLNKTGIASRKASVGDGNDNCTHSLPPTFEVISKVLREKSMSVIGLFRISKQYRPNVTEIYEEYFRKQIHVPFSSYILNLTNVPGIVKNIKQGIKENTKCLWADPTAYNTLGL